MSNYNGKHTGQVIKIKSEKDRVYAYQDESTYPGCYIKAYPPKRGTDEEIKNYQEYELFITKHTDSCFTVRMVKHRSFEAIQKETDEKGFAVVEEEYVRTFSFANFVNAIFADGCEVYFKEEPLMPEAREALKGVWTRRGEAEDKRRRNLE